MVHAQNKIWWLNPGWVFALMLVPFAVAADWIPNDEYVLFWKAGRFFETSDLLLCLECMAAFLLGGLLLTSLYRKKPRPEWGKFGPEELHLMLRVFRTGFWLVLFGYCVWTLLAIHHGVTLSVLKEQFLGGGDNYQVREMTGTWPGVTTTTQFAPAVFIIGTILYFNGKKKETRWQLIFLFFVTFLRSILYAERLALTEVAIPALVLVIYYSRPRLGALIRGLPGIFWPVTAVLLLYVLFTATESLRSWSYYESEGNYSTVWSYSRDRLLGYYVTALNNGCLSYRFLGQEEYPTATFEWLWKFPVIGSRLLNAISPSAELTYTDLLQSDANPEFNNMSGIFSYTMDWGEPGVFIFFFLAGVVVFAAYYSFVRGAAIGVLLYPFIFTGVTEIARIPYCTGSRCFPAWMMLFFVLLAFRKIRQKHRLRRREEIALAAGPQPRPVTRGAEAPAFTGISEAGAAPTTK